MSSQPNRTECLELIAQIACATVVNCLRKINFISSYVLLFVLELMLSSRMKCYHLGRNVIIWDEMLSSGMRCYHLELILSSGINVIIWDEMLLSGANVIIWEEMLSSEADVIIWFYHVILSSGMKTPPFLFFPKTSLSPQRTLFLLFANNNCFPTSDEKLVAFEFRRFFNIGAEGAGVVLHSVDFVVCCMANVFEGWRIFKIIAMTPK